jgi:hypothetical protein
LLAFGVLKDAIASAVGTVRSALNYASPRLYTRMARDERKARQRMARVLLASLDLLEYEVHWQRDVFTDIRVTVERPGASPGSRIPLLSGGRSRRSYQTATLVKTLREQREGLIRLEGAPGSGKSVALRAYCRSILDEAAKGGRLPGPLAIYANLRDFTATPDSVTATQLAKYIEHQVNQQESVELTRYFAERFAGDIAEGRIVLLLDSFDEIPSILGAADVKSGLPYIAAINALVGGGAAKCIVASRQYKGPRVTGWTMLNLVGMSLKEQTRLLESYDVPRKEIEALGPLLKEMRTGFAADLRNPLYLSLLAQFVVAHSRPPARPTEMFEDYVLGRLGDTDQANQAVLLAALESFARELTSVGAGLAADFSLLCTHIRRARRGMGVAEARSLAEKLADSKLLVNLPGRDEKSRRVAFVHRRVQEYLSSQWVVAHPREISAAELATEPRWRETAVTLLQVGTPESAAELVAELTAALDAELQAVRSAADDGSGFSWSPRAIHLLELVVSAFATGTDAVPAQLRELASQLTQVGWEAGLIDDRKFALDCLPVLEPGLQERIAVAAFSGMSVWLRLSALRDVSRLHSLPDSLQSAIRRLLITLMDAGRLRQEAPGIDIALTPLYHSDIYLRVRKVLGALPYAVVALLLGYVTVSFVVGGEKIGSFYDIRYQVLYGFLVPLGIFWLFQSTSPLSYATPSSGIRRFFTSFMGLIGWRRKDHAETDALWYGLQVLAIFLLLVGIGEMGYDLANGRVEQALVTDLALSLLFLYCLLWGPGVLYAIGEEWEPDGTETRFSRMLTKPVRSIAELFAAVGWEVPKVLGMLVLGLIPIAITIAALDGILFVLKYYAGHVGRDVGFGVGYALLAILPVGIVVLLVRAYLSRRKLKRTLAHDAAFGPARFLADLGELTDPAAAVTYLEMLRVRYPERLKSLPLAFVRDVEAALEPGRVVAETAWSVQIRELAEARSVLPEWGSGVLDEVGRISEFLREV